MQLTRQIKRFIKTMSPQDYLYNQRDSMLFRKTKVKTLKVLQNANQGDATITDQIQLVGTPKGEPYEKIKQLDTYKSLLYEHQIDLIHLQIDPSAYIARQRFMAHRCAMGQIEDYRKDGVHLIDPHKPITWEQTVVNLLTLDMLRNNQLPNEVNYKQGLFAYSYPQVRRIDEERGLIKSDEKTKQLQELFIRDISYEILQGKRTGYNVIDRALYAGLMGKHKIMLGGMPQTLYRMILGKSLSVQEMRDAFRLIVTKNKQLTIPMNLKDASENFLPHIFLLPKDLYMTAILKQSFQASISMLSIVAMEHWIPIQNYWVGPPHGVNWTQATAIPQGFPGQTTDNLIEKQAMLDVLLQSRVWSKNYLSNPFPYLFQDISKIENNELKQYKNKFLKYYRQYSEFKNRQQKQLPHMEPTLSLEASIKQQQQQVQKLKSDYKNSFQLSYLQKLTKRKSTSTQSEKI